MENEKNNLEKVYDNYEKGWNGRMRQEELPEVQQKITYPHPNKTGEMTSQNYIEYNDLAVVIFIRKNKEGVFEFGLIEQEAPAFIYDSTDKATAQGYNGIFLEAPSFALPEKNNLPNDMAEWMEAQILSMGIEMQGFSELDDSKTAICQSFTNQNARFYVAGIKFEEQNTDNKIHWFPMSSLESYLDIQRMGGKEGLHSSIQTLYPLEQLRNKYLPQIKEMEPTEFNLDRDLPELKLVEKSKTNPSYRFSIWECSYINTDDPEKIKVATYINSMSNAGNCILMTKDGKTMFLSPQKRSPFMAVGEELKMEVAGGLTEGRPYDVAALAELSEEQAFETESAEAFTGPLAATPLNSELSQAFIAHYEQGREGEQHLDEKESIGQKQPKSFEELKGNLKRSDIPLTTKYYIMLKSRDDEKVKDKRKTDIEIEK